MLKSFSKLKKKKISNLKYFFLNFDRSITFCFGVSLNLLQQKSPTAEIFGKYFLRTIVPRKYMGKISAVGLFCCDKFEETPKQKVIDLSKLKIFYFSSEILTLDFDQLLTSMSNLFTPKPR